MKSFIICQQLADPMLIVFNAGKYAAKALLPNAQRFDIKTN
ncbi:hypothetical protein [Pseudoalteromonas nigrifaciens]